MSAKFPHVRRASGRALLTGPIGNWLANSVEPVLIPQSVWRTCLGGGYTVWKRGVGAAGHWKLNPKRLRQKWNLGPKRWNSVRIGSLIPQKIVSVLVDEKKYPQKSVFNPQNVKKKGQNSGTSILVSSKTNVEGVPFQGSLIVPIHCLGSLYFSPGSVAVLWGVGCRGWHETFGHV